MARLHRLKCSDLLSAVLWKPALSFRHWCVPCTGVIVAHLPRSSYAQTHTPVATMLCCALLQDEASLRADRIAALEQQLQEGAASQQAAEDRWVGG